jgi:hypothetical protein
LLNFAVLIKINFAVALASWRFSDQQTSSSR